MDIDTLHGLALCPLFNGLQDSEIIDLMHKVRYRVTNLYKGDIHAYAGYACQYADIIISGEMVAHLVGPSGRAIRMMTHQPGTLLAPAFLFADNNQYPVSIEANVSTTILRLAAADLERLLQMDQRLMMNYIRLLSNTVARLTKKISMLSLNVREKLVLYLKEQSRLQQSNEIILPLSRQELAEHFGIQKYSLLRCLNELKQDGLIQVDGRRIRILSKLDINM